jgi:hypothetical protein
VPALSRWKWFGSAETNPFRPAPEQVVSVRIRVLERFTQCWRRWIQARIESRSPAGWLSATDVSADGSEYLVPADLPRWTADGVQVAHEVEGSDSPDTPRVTVEMAKRATKGGSLPESDRAMWANIEIPTSEPTFVCHDRKGINESSTAEVACLAAQFRGTAPEHTRLRHQPIDHAAWTGWSPAQARKRIRVSNWARAEADFLPHAPARAKGPQNG